MLGWLAGMLCSLGTVLGAGAGACLLFFALENRLPSAWWLWPPGCRGLSRPCLFWVAGWGIPVSVGRVAFRFWQGCLVLFSSPITSVTMISMKAIKFV